MYLSIFLHLYQPPDQSPDVLERIVNESYRPLIAGFIKNPNAKVTLNINACLTQMLEKYKYDDVINGLRVLAKRGQLEFTSSGKYHPFLPILPDLEMIRQINLNDATNKKIFGAVYQPKGFFPPEMGYSQRVGKIVSQMGYKWIILDEISYNGKTEAVVFDRLYRLKNEPLMIFFRNRRVSNLIMSAMTRSGESLWEAMKKDEGLNRYTVVAMDGETFGHHRPGLDNTLFNIYSDKHYEFKTLSQLLDLYKKTEEVSPVDCTWATSEIEINEGNNFYLYYNSKNKLHKLQKQLLDLAIKAVNPKNRDNLDRALSCNHMWWSNPDAWWSIEEIEIGANNLRNVIKNKEGDGLYYKIVETAFQLQRSGTVKKLHEEKESFKKIPFSGRAKPGEYDALIGILKKEEKRAVERGEYELAIRWRDSIYKLEKKLDVYDFVHIIDQMWAENRLGEYEALAQKYRESYRKLTPGQPDK